MSIELGHVPQVPFGNSLFAIATHIRLRCPTFASRYWTFRSTRRGVRILFSFIVGFGLRVRRVFGRNCKLICFANLHLLRFILFYNHLFLYFIRLVGTPVGLNLHELLPLFGRLNEPIIWSGKLSNWAIPFVVGVRLCFSDIRNSFLVVNVNSLISLRVSAFHIIIFKLIIVVNIFFVVLLDINTIIANLFVLVIVMVKLPLFIIFFHIWIHMM